MITIEQKPLKLTPVNTQHIYTVSSPNSGNTDFRYIFDLYVDTNTSDPDKVSRLLVSPNTYGKGIINVEDIVRNYVEGNIRSERPQYTSETTTGTTPYGLITNVKGITPSNQFNDDTNYNKQVHVRDYRVMVGEQWTTGSTATLDKGTVQYISTASTTPGSTFMVEDSSGRLYWYAAGANIPEGSSLETGVNWYYQATSGTSSNYDGNILPISPTPISGYTVEIIEKYSGIQGQFMFDGIRWNLVGYTYPSDYDPTLSPPAVTIWPGTTIKQGSYITPTLRDSYWTDTEPSRSHQYQEVTRYRMSGTTVSAEEPSMFLTSAGDTLYTINDATPGIVTTRARRRNHHPSCPILLSWFNGNLSNDDDLEFNNDVTVFNTATASTHSSSYGFPTEELIPYSGYTGLTPQNERILYHNEIRPDLAGGKIGYWLSNSVGEYQYEGYAYSEFIEFHIKEDDCLSDPIHVAFLNRQGVWDTYTLDRKALETKTIERKTYDKGLISDTNLLGLLSSNRRKTIYDQNIVESMNVSTWFLEDNDKQILEDLFMSPEVYIIMDHDWTGKTEKSYNPYLLPVVVRTDTLQEFKNRYNKRAQYNFTLEYTPINQYNTQG